MTNSCRRRRRVLGRPEAVAVADEHQPAAGQRARPHVEDAVVELGLAVSGVRQSFDQSAAPVLGVKIWWVSRTILRVLHVDLVDVGAPSGG